MGNSYTRQSAADIVDGNIVTAAPINAEFNALQNFADGTTGHSHDGTVGEGPKISLTNSIIGVLPVINGGLGGINKVNATTAPTANDDSADGYTEGSLWIDITNNVAYICVDATVATAIWQRYTLYDAGLTSIAGLTTAADTMIYTTASDLYATTALTPFARTLIDDTTASAALTTLGVSTFVKTILDDVDAAAVRTTIGNGTIATQDSNNVTITGGAISGATLNGALTSSNVTVTGGTITGITDLAIADGGTGSSTAATARTALGTDNASNLTLGTVADARLPSTQAGKTFTSTVIFQGGLTTLDNAGDRDLFFRTAAGLNQGVVYSAGADGAMRIQVYDAAGNPAQVLVMPRTGSMSWGSGAGSIVWTGANDGAGSGMDADLLDGFQSATGGGANTIALRGSDGSVRGSVLMADGAANSSTIYIGSNGTHYLQYDGSNYILNAGNLYIDSSYGYNFRGTGARLQSDGNVIFDGGMASLYGTALNNALDARAVVYGGTGTGDTVFPIGHTIIVNNTTTTQRNQPAGVWINSGNSTQYNGSVSGAALSGTWRARGFDNSNGTLMQRTA